MKGINMSDKNRDKFPKIPQQGKWQQGGFGGENTIGHRPPPPPPKATGKSQSSGSSPPAPQPRKNNETQI
jgi:hypothetical protein